MNTLHQQSSNQGLITNTNEINTQSKLLMVWVGGTLKLAQS